MEKIYTVCWGSAGQDDDGNSKAFSGVFGTYTSKEVAKRALEDCKIEMYNEVVNDYAFDGCDESYIEENVKVYGSVEEDYFEIDYNVCDFVHEIYINLVETSLR